MDEKERITRLEEMTKSDQKRLDGLEDKVENIYQLTASVKEIATEMKAMREDVNKIEGRVDIIEEKPGKNWDKMVSIIITGIVTAIIGYLLAKLGM